MFNRCLHKTDINPVSGEISNVYCHYAEKHNEETNPECYFEEDWE